MNYYSAKTVQELYKQTNYEPKRWLKNQLSPSEHLILAQREAVRVSLQEKLWKLPLKGHLAVDWVDEETDARWRFRPPTLKAPAFFGNPLNGDLKSQLKSHLAESPKLVEALPIIDRARLELCTPQFYAEVVGAEFTIFGNPAATVGNLLCFAHEVGHALYDLESLGDEVGSEIYAFMFEDFIAALILKTESEKTAWKLFKQEQDELNYFLWRNEICEYETGVSQIASHHLFFRESLVTCWGYQGINAAASYYRSNQTLDLRSLKPRYLQSPTFA